MLCVLAFCRTLTFITLLNHLTFMMRRRQHWWNWSRSLMCLRYSVQDSQPYSKALRTTALYTAHFVSMLSPLVTPNSLLQPTIAGTCLCNTGRYFIVKGAGGWQAASRYVKESTQFRILPSISILGVLAVDPLAGWNNTSVFLILIVNPNLPVAIERESASCCRSCSLWLTIAQSSAYNSSRLRASVTFVFARKRCRLKTTPFVRYEIWMPDPCSWRQRASSYWTKRLKSVGASTHPCFTRWRHGNHLLPFH